MTRKLFPCALIAVVATLAGCTIKDESVLHEPIVMEEAAMDARSLPPCDVGDDGIGGTGCEPLE